MITKKKKLPSYVKWAIFALIAGGIAFAVYQFFFKSKETPPSYLTAEAKIGDIEETVLASGKVEAIQSIDVGAQVSGEIVRLYVDVGDEVKKGDPIAQISEVEQKNTVANAQATLNQARASLLQAQASLSSSTGSVDSAIATLNARQAELVKAQKAFDRLQGLIDIDAISRQDYDDAKATLDVALANVKAAEAAVQNAHNDVASAKANIKSQEAAINKAENDLNTATEDLSHTTITAPMDGIIVSVSQKQGTTVNANQSAPTIVTLADLSRVRINTQISEADVVKVKTGLPARFNIIGDPNTFYDATLAGIEPKPESSSSSSEAIYYIGYLDVDNAERKFRIDMTTQVNIIVNSIKGVLTIPSTALKQENGKNIVRVVQKDGFATPIEVQVGLNNRVNVEIKSGLSAGDKVVISDSTQTEGNLSKQRGGPPMM